MIALKVFALIMLLVSVEARADLYRWVDPETGSVKFSNHPPALVGGRYPAKVDVIPYQPLGYVAPPSPTAQAAAAAAAAKAAPKPAATPDATGVFGALEGRWRSMLEAFAGVGKADFDRSAAAFQQQAEAYAAVSAELDRLDPKGAARRKAEAQQTGFFEQVLKGLAAGISSSPQKK